MYAETIYASHMSCDRRNRRPRPAAARNNFDSLIWEASKPGSTTASIFKQVKLGSSEVLRRRDDNERRLRSPRRPPLLRALCNRAPPRADKLLK